MALKVWIPGTIDYNDQGLNNSSITNTGVTIDANGKIGGCLKFNNTGNLIGKPGPLNNDTNDWTFACWMKVNSSHNGCLFSDRTEINTTGVSIFYYRSEWLVDDGVRWQFTPRTAISANTWYHVCVVRKKNVGKYLYINGILDSSTATTGTPTTISTQAFAIGNSQSSSTAVTVNQFNGYLNDIRVYDTALSPREIKEIAKGLVLHYTLAGVGQKNYIDTVTIASVPSNGSTSIIEDGVKTNGLNKDTYFSIKLDTNLVAGTTYTLSFYAEGMTDGTALNFGLGAQSSSSTQYCGLVMVHNGFNTHVFTPNVAFSGQIIMDDTNRNGLPIVNMKYFKIEEGDIATPWCVSENDPRYTIIGMSDGIEYDVSGYSHNGTKTNTEFSSDTPRNIGSLYFDGTSLIQANPLPPEVKTISVWCKTTKNKSTSQFICQDSASGLCVTFYNGNIITHLGGGYSTGSKCILGDSYIENGWNHFVVLKTGTHTRDVYCNGVKLTPTSNDYWSPTTGFLVGARNMSNRLPFYGYISDLRAYATQLSENDIMELYQVGASLANNGVLMAHEFIE